MDTHGPRIARRGNRLGVPETDLGRMQFHPDGTRIPDGLTRPPSNPGSIDRAVTALCRPKAAPFVRAWMDYAKPQNLEKFRSCMNGIHAQGGSGRRGSAANAEPMETTYMVDISRNLATRYLGPAASIDPASKGELYARHIFKPESLPTVSKWLVKASEKQRDSFRDAFASLTTYYKSRKGARSEYVNEVKNKDPDFRARMREHDERDAEFANRTMRRLEEEVTSGFSTTNGVLGRAPASPGGGHTYQQQQQQQAQAQAEAQHGRRATSSRGSSRAQSRSGVRTGAHSSNAMRQIAENQKERERVLEEGRGLVARITDHYGYMIKPRAMETLDHWVAFARPEYKRGLEKLLHNVKKTASRGPGGSAVAGRRKSGAGAGQQNRTSALSTSNYATTTGQANAMATRGFATTDSNVAADQLVKLYGRSFFREPAWPIVALYLAAATPGEVDLYRQVFSSFASYHAERKGPRSLNRTDFKYESRKKREAMVASKETLDLHGLGKHAVGPNAMGAIRAPQSTMPDKPPTEGELAQRRKDLMDTLKNTAHLDAPKGSFASRSWRETGGGKGSGSGGAVKMTAKDARPDPVGSKFDKPEQQSVLGPVRGHGGFFSKTEAQMSHGWKVAEPDDIAKAIKAKNTKGNNPLGGMLSTGPSHFQSSYRGSFKGARGERARPVKAEFYE